MRDSTVIIAPSGEKHTKDKRGEFKKSNTYWRWNLLLLFFTAGLVPLGLWLGFVSPGAAFIFQQVSGWLGIFLLLVVSINIIRNTRVLERNFDKNWREVYKASKDTDVEMATTTFDNVLHVAICPCYKEPLSVIEKSINTIAKSTVVQSIIVVVAFEEGTPDAHDKCQQLARIYKGKFYSFHCTIHPRGYFGEREIPGKCSNQNYALKSILTLLDKTGVDTTQTIVTSLDADTLFPARYFEFLTYDFLVRKDSLPVIWQAPLSYNFKLLDRPWFVRTLAIFRSAMMMGFFIPFKVNPMSVYSMSLALAKSAFSHPSYQMEDLTTYVSSCIQAKTRVPMVMVPMPVVNGTTSGENLWEESVEWKKQGERWTIGAAETLHFICVKGRGSLNCTSLLWFVLVFTVYYGFILCAMTLCGLLSLVSSLIVTDATYTSTSLWLLVASFLLNYLFYAVFFWFDRKLVTLTEKYKLTDRKTELAGPCKNLVHWILMYPSILLYSLIVYYSIWLITIYGKKVCGHVPAKKDVIGDTPKSVNKEQDLELEPQAEPGPERELSIALEKH